VNAQLQLELEVHEPNPNTDFFDSSGKPRRLLWCSDSARMGGPCPYVGDRARFLPAAGCCKDIRARGEVSA
jgi:hypothetical protein